MTTMMTPPGYSSGWIHGLPPLPTALEAGAVVCGNTFLSHPTAVLKSIMPKKVLQPRWCGTDLVGREGCDQLTTRVATVFVILSVTYALYTGSVPADTEPTKAPCPIIILHKIQWDVIRTTDDIKLVGSLTQTIVFHSQRHSMYQ